jgi:hypothetical protein
LKVGCECKSCRNGAQIACEADMHTYFDKNNKYLAMISIMDLNPK